MTKEGAAMNTMGSPMKFMVAAAIGFAAGMLFAPRSGTETREKLRTQAQEAKGRAQNAAAQLRQKKDDMAEQVQQGAQELKQQGQDAKETVRRRTRSAREEAQGGDENQTPQP